MLVMGKLLTIVMAVTFATSALERVAGTLGLLAGAVTALGVLGFALRGVWRFAMRVDEVVENTGALPEFMVEQLKTNKRVEDRLARGEQRFEAIERALGCRPE